MCVVSDLDEQLSVVREFSGRPAGVQRAVDLSVSAIDLFMRAYSGRSLRVRPCGAHVPALTPREARRRTAAVWAYVYVRPAVRTATSADGSSPNYCTVRPTLNSACKEKA